MSCHACPQENSISVVLKINIGVKLNLELSSGRVSSIRVDVPELAESCLGLLPLTRLLTEPYLAVIHLLVAEH